MNISAVGTAFTCQSGAIAWIQHWFQDCVYTHRDLLSFLVGLSSIAFWLVAQLPQFIENIRSGTADALSPWFLVQWLSVSDSLQADLQDTAFDVKNGV